MPHVENGRYSNSLEPLLDVFLLGPNGDRVSFPALIDTGYNKTLMIYETERREANLPQTWNRAVTFEFAHGETGGYRTQGFLGWFGPPTEVEISVIPVERTEGAVCVIGMELLIGKQIVLGQHSFSIEEG